MRVPPDFIDAIRMKWRTGDRLSVHDGAIFIVRNLVGCLPLAFFGFSS